VIFLNQDRKFTHISLDSTTSTQDEALRLYNRAGCGNFIVTAKNLTKGRGRNGNIWVTPAHNLNFTMFISSHLKSIKVVYLPFILSLAVFELISYYLDKEKVSIKWPNDILINGKKIAGILVETAISSTTRKIMFVNIGIGINIATAPVIEDRETTSIKSHTTIPLNTEMLIQPLKEKILYWLDKANEIDWDQLKKLWLNKTDNFGREITTSYNNSKITGIFEELGDNGELILRLYNGEKLTISSGVIT